MLLDVRLDPKKVNRYHYQERDTGVSLIISIGEQNMNYASSYYDSPAPYSCEQVKDMYEWLTENCSLKQMPTLEHMFTLKPELPKSLTNDEKIEAMMPEK